MLKEDPTARFLETPFEWSGDKVTFIAGSHRVISCTCHAALQRDEIDKLSERSKLGPVEIPGIKFLSRGIRIRNIGKHWWLWGGKFYVTEEELSAEDVKALAMERQNTKRLKLEKAHALQAMRDQLDSTTKRQPIPQEVKIAVWQRDKGRCVECESNKELEYDHIIPLSMGGSNTERNLQLLCAVCNRRKGGTLG